MKDNTRGLRRIVRSFLRRLGPRAPFRDDRIGKGVWEGITHAPRHVWRHYRLDGFLSKPVVCIVLSDLHVGSHARDIDRFQELVREVGERHFDLILLPGDFMNMQVFGHGRISPSIIADILAPLAQRAPVIAVPGNHDAEYGISAIADHLAARGVTFLVNACMAVETNSGRLNVVGLDDHSTGRPDFIEATHGMQRDLPTLVVAHDPASFADVPHWPLVTICGHTHGGQFRLPVLGPLTNASDAPMGWTRGHIVEDGKHLIVSAGLGTSGLPWRINCPPEIVEVVIS